MYCWLLYVIHVLAMPVPHWKMKWETFEILICEKFYWFLFCTFFHYIDWYCSLWFNYKRHVRKFDFMMLWLFLAVWDDGWMDGWGEDVLRNLNIKQPLRVNYDYFLRYLWWRQSLFEDNCEFDLKVKAAEPTKH